MTQKEFIKKLDLEGYSYKIEGDKIIVTHRGDVYLESLTSLPPGVVFSNEGDVYLNSLTSIPPGVEFKNKGDVMLFSLKSLPPDVVFSNEGDVNLDALTSISPGVEFSNEGDVQLDALTIGGWFFEWKGNIEGIDSKRLLNSMISKGIFER